MSWFVLMDGHLPAPWGDLGKLQLQLMVSTRSSQGLTLKIGNCNRGSVLMTTHLASADNLENILPQTSLVPLVI